jgi:hypothetical protein
MLVARMERELKQSQSKPIQVSAICAPRARYLSHIQPLSQPRIRFDRDPSVGRLLRVEVLDVLGIAIRPDEFNSPLSPLHVGGRKSEPRQKRFVTGLARRASSPSTADDDLVFGLMVTVSVCDGMSCSETSNSFTSSMLASTSFSGPEGTTPTKCSARSSRCFSDDDGHASR